MPLPAVSQLAGRFFACPNNPGASSRSLGVPRLGAQVGCPGLLSPGPRWALVAEAWPAASVNPLHPSSASKPGVQLRPPGSVQGTGGSEPPASVGCKRRGETCVSLPKGFALMFITTSLFPWKGSIRFVWERRCPLKGRGHSRLFEEIPKVLRCSAGVRAGSPVIRCLTREVIIIRK